MREEDPLVFFNQYDVLKSPWEDIEDRMKHEEEEKSMKEEREANYGDITLVSARMPAQE